MTSEKRYIAAAYVAHQFALRKRPNDRARDILGQISTELMEHYREVNPEAALGTVTTDVLTLCRKMSGRTQAHIVDCASHVTGKSVHVIRTYHVRKLEAAGYIERQRDEDGRIVITAIGERDK
jgi:predicted MarR family transcription regulator